MSRLLDLLGVRLPIIQAPMAGVQDKALALAVSNAGALGSLPCAMLSPDAIRSEWVAMRSTSDKPVNLNFFCHTLPQANLRREAAWREALEPYYVELGLKADAGPAGPARLPFGQHVADMLEEFRPSVVSFHFGLPPESLLSQVKAWGSRILSSATTVEEARWLEARGVDAIVAQGIEAGGHRGMFLSDDLSTQIGTLALVHQVVRAVRVPVIAAGGIADSAGVAAVMKLGAAGAQVGTAYLLCPESTVTAVHRHALKGESAGHTALTNLFSGRPARGIMNRAMRELGPISTVAPDFPLATAAIAPLRAAAEKKGSADFSPLWAGQNTSGCRELPAAELTAQLAAGF